jgi:mannosyltransferase
VATGELVGRPETADPRGLSLRDLLLIGGIAAILRLVGLSHVSLWLDEILGTLQTSGTLADTWEQLKGVRVHPPLWGLVNWLTQQVTESELLRRLVPIALGVATVLFLADLVARHFGRTTAIFAGLIAALSPLHIRYSQELRAYPLGLLLFVLALWALDRAVERGGRRNWAVFAVVVWAGVSSLYLVGLVVVPGLLMVLMSRKGEAERYSDLRRFLVALGIAGLAFAPWYGIVGKALAKEHELAATQWSFELLAQRWHFLTAASREGESANAGSIAFLVVALVGVAIALRSREGRLVLAGLVAGTVGVELALVLLNHWSNGRYAISAWPFLVVILALGCKGIGSMLRAALPRVALRGAVSLAPLLVLLVLLCAQILGAWRYYTTGRPDWRSLAQELFLASSTSGEVLVSNEWTRVSLGYYLAQLEGARRPSVAPRVRVVGSPGEIASSASCRLLVAAGFPERPELDGLFGSSPAQKSYMRTGARLVAIPPSSSGNPGDPWRCFPPALEDAPGERTPLAWGGFLRYEELRSRLEMDEASASQLPFGWSFPETNRAGVTFRWALGRWAAVRLPVAHGRMRLRAWGWSDDQRVTIHRQHLPVAELSLQQKPATFEIEWSGGVPLGESEVVYFHFASSAPADRGARPLAAGFDQLELVD